MGPKHAPIFDAAMRYLGVFIVCAALLFGAFWAFDKATADSTLLFREFVTGPAQILVVFVLANMIAGPLVVSSYLLEILIELEGKK